MSSKLQKKSLKFCLLPSPQGMFLCFLFLSAFPPIKNSNMFHKVSEFSPPATNVHQDIGSGSFAQKMRGNNCGDMRGVTLNHILFLGKLYQIYHLKSQTSLKRTGLSI